MASNAITINGEKQSDLNTSLRRRLSVWSFYLTASRQKELLSDLLEIMH
ncbi:hypothetical protein ACNKHV_10270 [Shigella flexneri]